MNSRQRQLYTIERKNTDRISVDAICIENQAAIAKFLHIDINDVLDRLGIDGRIISAGYTGELLESKDGITFTEWGTPNTGDYGAWRKNPLTNIESVFEVENYRWPNIKDYDFDRAGAYAKAIGDKYALRGPYWMPIFCRACDLFGMEEAMVKMINNPAVFEATLEIIFIHTTEFCERLILTCGDNLPILCLGDDFATQRGLMISPDYWRKFLKSRYAKLFEIGKKYGKFVWFHSCGDITSILPDLIDIGIDVWETVQLHTLPISPQQLKKQYGKYITFFGGINTQRLPFMTSEEVRKEVIRCIEILGDGGGYICGPDHHIKPDVSAENTITLFDTALSFHQKHL